MIGQTFSHYRIEESLGSGGMGVVYKAVDTVLERTVALKVMNPGTLADPSLSRRFIQEARSAAALHHPNIATIFEASEFEGTHFIAMEFVEGQSLRARIDVGLSFDAALHIAIDVVSGLVHAHEHRVVHRDLKPDNVLVAATGSAKILDFGLAKVLREAAAPTDATMAATMAAGLTVRGEILGTPAYMSPEQARGQDVDFRTDLFSFGSILHEMVTGKRAFAGTTALDVLSAILKEAPPAPSRVVLTLPPEIDHIVSRCLEKDVQARYSSTQELLEDLKAISAKTSHAAGTTRIAARRAQQAMRSRRRLVTGIGTGVVAAIAALLVTTRPWSRSNGETSETPDGKAVAATSPTSGRPSWMLVGDFAGTGIQPDLALATRELVSAALGQSGVVTPIPRLAVQQQLRLMGLPDSTRVTGEVAREIAFRASATTYLVGRMDKVFTGYSIVLDVKNAENDSTKLVVRGVASRDEQVITTLDSLARELRSELGDRESDVQSTRQLTEVLTPNFEAYRAYARAMALQYERKYAPSNRALRTALALDKDFASAWKLMGVNYTNLVLMDSARVAFDAARKHPERLTPAEKLGLEVFVAYTVEYDLPKADGLYETLAKEKMTATQVNNRGTVLFGLGRYEDALEAQRRAAVLDPFGLELFRYNQFRTLMQLGKIEEADSLLSKLTSTNLELAKLELAIAKGSWTTAEALATAQASASSASLQYQSKLVLASLEARRGAVGAATQSLGALTKSPIPFYGSLAEMARIHLALATGAATGPASAPTDTTSEGWILRGIAAAAGGDLDTARRAKSAVAHKPPAEKRRYAVDAALLDGWIAFAEKRWDDVTTPLGEAMKGGPGPWFVGRPAIRWLVAQAYEQAGSTASAVAAYESVLDPTREHHDVWAWWALLVPFAHERLATLEAGAGRMERARTHLRALESDWESADPALRSRLEAARRAVRGPA